MQKAKTHKLQSLACVWEAYTTGVSPMFTGACAAHTRAVNSACCCSVWGGNVDSDVLPANPIFTGGHKGRGDSRCLLSLFIHFPVGLFSFRLGGIIARLVALIPHGLLLALLVITVAGVFLHWRGFLDHLVSSNTE